MHGSSDHGWPNIRLSFFWAFSMPKESNAATNNACFLLVVCCTILTKGNKDNKLGNSRRLSDVSRQLTINDSIGMPMANLRMVKNKELRELKK